MPYNQQLAERIRQKLIPIVPVGPEKHATALKETGAHPFDMTGKPMSGWVMVSKNGYSSDSDLERWIHLALEFVKTLPPK